MSMPALFPFLSISPKRALWLKGMLIAAAVVVISLNWLNTRISMLRISEKQSKVIVLSGYYIYHGMATALKEGRVGQIDWARFLQFDSAHDPLAEYKQLAPGVAPRWVSYYTLDIGYSFIVQIARMTFRSLPDNVLRALALQFWVDALLVVFVFYLFFHWNIWMGLLAAYLYASNAVFSVLVSFAYYYYWDIPLSFIVLGCLVFAHRQPDLSRVFLALMGFVLGCGVWLRGSWWPIALFIFAFAALTRSFRSKLLLPLMVFVLVSAPQVIRSSAVRGQLTLSTRTVWHVALVGLGYYPNPYGLRNNDGAIFELTRKKYGIEFRSEDYYLHDQAAKKEFLSIWHDDPWFIIRSFEGRLKESVLGETETSVLTYLFLSNRTYRLLCLLGLAAMIARGGEWRLLGLAAAGMYTTYVLVTCVFYFVGLAYDNVSEVALFVCFIGGVDCLRYGLTRLAARVPVRE